MVNLIFFALVRHMNYNYNLFGYVVFQLTGEQNGNNQDSAGSMTQTWLMTRTLITTERIKKMQCDVIR